MIPNDKVHAITADIGKTIEPKPVTDKVIEVDVARMIKIEFIDSKIVLRVLYDPYLFFGLWFLSLKYIICSLMLLTW